MEKLNVVVALTTRENDYQAEQAVAVAEMATRLGIKVQIIYADNDAVNQTQQLIKIIQDPAQRPTAILVEPVGTGMAQVAKAAVAAGIGWGIINSDPDYIAELRQGGAVPVFSVSTDQAEVGRIQGKQIGVLVPAGSVLYIEGPFNSMATQLRTKGMLSTDPWIGRDVLQRLTTRRSGLCGSLQRQGRLPQVGIGPGRRHDMTPSPPLSSTGPP